MVVLGPGTGLGVAAYVPAFAWFCTPQRRWPCHGAKRLVAGGRHHREVASAVRARIRRTYCIRTRAWKISTAPLRRLTRGLCRSVPRPRSRKPLSRMPARSVWPLSMCSARCSATSPAILRSASVRRGECLLPAELRPVSAIICPIAVSFPFRGKGPDESVCRGYPGLSDPSRRSRIHRSAVACRATRVAGLGAKRWQKSLH